MKVLKYIPALSACFVFLFLTGCNRRTYIPVEKTITIEKAIRDTIVDVRIEQSRDSVVTADTASYLQNVYCESRAIYSGGKLRHSLNTKDRPIPVSFQFVSTNTRVVEPVIHPVEKIVYREKELSKGQMFRMRMGDLTLFSLIFALIVFWVRKRRGNS